MVFRKINSAATNKETRRSRFDSPCITNVFRLITIIFLVEFNLFFLARASLSVSSIILKLGFLFVLCFELILVKLNGFFVCFLYTVFTAKY